MKKKRQQKSIVRDQVCAQAVSTLSADHLPLGQQMLPAKAEHVRYVLDDVPREEPTVIPRLFIQGAGGSIKLDLSGLGINLDSGSFCFMVSDDTLKDRDICKGDIAIIESSNRAIVDGSILLVLVEGKQKLCPAVNRNGILSLHTRQEGSDRFLPLYNLPYQGIALGFLRLFVPTNHINYRPSESYYDPPKEFPTRYTSGNKAKAGGHSNRYRAKRLSKVPDTHLTEGAG